VAAKCLAGVTDCTVEGAGVGGLRMLTYGDGSTIVERLEAHVAETQRLSYAPLPDTPFGYSLTTVAVCDLGLNQADIV